MGDSQSEDSANSDPSCRHCGEPVTATGERRVVTSIEDGTVVYREFCSTDCLERSDR